MSDLKYGSICSGIEAATVAWHPLGWKPAFFSEIDTFPRAVLAHHFPTVPLHGDFTTIQDGQYEPIDLLVGGTPCQDFSVAGKRAGLDGERGNLTLEYAGLARRLRARWLVWENVPGVFSNNGGRDFGAVLACFAGGSPGKEFQVPKGGWQNAGIAPPLSEHGYGLAWRVLDAQFAGVPQRRRRVFVVGYLGEWRRAAAVLFERHSLQGHSAPSRGPRQDVAGALAGVSPGGGWRVGADEAAAGQVIGVALRGRAGGGTAELTGEISPAIRTGGGGGDKAHVMIAGTLNANGKAAGSATSQDAESGLLIPFDTTQITSPANRSNPRDGDVCHPLAAGMHAPAIAFQATGAGFWREGLGPLAVSDDNGGNQLLAFGGNNTSGPIDCATALAALAAHGGPHGRQDFASETFIVQPILEAGARTGISTTDERAGIGIGDAGDPMFTLQAGKQHAIAFSCKDHGADAGDTAPTLRAMGHSGSHANAGGQVAVAIHGTQDPDVAIDHAHALGRNQGRENAICVTGKVTHALKADGADGSEDGTGRGNPIVPQMRGGVRRLTPLECERLQGFPDGWTDVPYRGKRAADGPRYKALGNSMAVPCMAWIGQRIDMLERALAGQEAAE